MRPLTSSRIRYSDPALDDIASVLVAAYPGGAEYLAQAPVIAAVACQKFPQNLTYGEIDKFGGVVARQPKLRDVLTAYGVSGPARKLSAAAIRIKDAPAIKEILRIEPSSLSQCIPAQDSQRLWLDGISDWLRLTPTKKADRKRFSVVWIARHLAAYPARCGQVGSIVDYVARGGGEINDRWTWERALQEVTAWHNRLNDEYALRRMLADEQRRVDFEKVICKAPLPDLAEVEGFQFITLRTGRALQEEGVTMHHCVASYAYNVKRGDCAIVSIRRDGVNIATLEISKKGVPGQIKAHCNTAPAKQVRDAAALYALEHWRPTQSEAA